MNLLGRVVHAVVIVSTAALTAVWATDNSGDNVRGLAGLAPDEWVLPEDAATPETAVRIATWEKPPPGIEPSTDTEFLSRPARVAESVADLLRQYLFSEFGSPGSQAPWYARVQRVAVGLHTAAIHTDLSSDTGDIAAAQAVCQAVALFPKSAQGRHVTTLNVDVYGSGGQLLASQYGSPPPPVSRSRSGLTPLHIPQHNSPIFPLVPSPEPSSNAASGDEAR
jgi:hypothetical protein